MNCSSSRAVSGVWREVDAEENAQQRHPRHERRIETLEHLEQPRLDLRGVGARVDSEHLSHRSAEREVRR